MGHDAHRVPRPAGADDALDRDGDLDHGGDLDRDDELDRESGCDHDDSLDHDVEEVIAAVLTTSRLLVAISARALAQVEPALTLPQLRTLVVLDSQGPVKLATLAGALGVNPSTAMRMVDRLEAAGSVTRQANPGNRREVALSLTAKGHDLVERVLAHRHTEIAAIVARLPAAQRAGLVESLRALTEAAGEPPVAPRPAPPESAAP